MRERERAMTHTKINTPRNVLVKYHKISTQMERIKAHPKVRSTNFLYKKYNFQGACDKNSKSASSRIKALELKHCFQKHLGAGQITFQSACGISDLSTSSTSSTQGLFW